MRQSKEEFRQRLLRVAERHLGYVLTDPTLGLGSREARRKKVRDFYAKALNDAGMSGAMQDVYEIDRAVAAQSSLRGRERNRYHLQELLTTARITDNVTTFRVLELGKAAGIQRQQSEDGIDFVVDGRGVAVIVEYLKKHHNIDYDRLRRVRK